MAKTLTGPASAASAWENGLAAGAQGAAWLARAARLAPDDPRIALDLARLLLAGDASDIAEAEAGFARIAVQYDALQAWMGLALARHRLGRAKGAATALQNLLARHCLPGEPEFALLAQRIALAAGFSGFRGMTVSGKIRASATAERLLGPPLEIATLTRVEGLVAAKGLGLSGWASRLASPDMPPALTLHDASGRSRRIRFGNILPAEAHAPFLIRHGFVLSPRQLRGLTPPFGLRGPDGADIFGSPVDPAALAAMPALPARHRGPPCKTVPPKAKLAIIVPLYRGVKETQACLEALFAAAPRGSKIILVDDATPEPALTAWAADLAAAGRVTLLRHAENRGFAAAVNTALTAAGPRDVLLLNSDTLVPQGAIAVLRKIAYAQADTGTVTPLSNDATILSTPNPRGGNAVPDLAQTIALHRIAHQANGHQHAEIPTGIGFCLYIRHDCLRATGGLRPEIFAQGYGEENDFCLRARHAGFTHRAAFGAYVAHIGGVSFRAAAHGLIARNLAILNRLYPGYHEMVIDFIAADPLAAARARMDALRLKAGDTREAVLLISHSHGGGVARQVAVQMAELRAQGWRPLLLTPQFPEDPENTPYPWPALLSEGDAGDYPNLTFALPQQKPALLRLLRALRVRRVILHHALGHHACVRGLAAALGVKQEIVIHDYASFCPRVALLARPDAAAPPRYCGEPEVKTCIACCARDESGIYEALPVPRLIARSRAEFSAAARVIAPSADAAQRIARHFPGIQPHITPWEDDALPLRLTPPGAGRRRIAVIGGIGPSKGFDLLTDCARDAASRNLALEFIVVGSSADDAALLETGRVFVSGAYQEGEATSIIARLHAGSGLPALDLAGNLVLRLKRGLARRALCGQLQPRGAGGAHSCDGPRLHPAPRPAGAAHQRYAPALDA